MKRKCALLLTAIMLVLPNISTSAQESVLVEIESEFTELNESSYEIFPIQRWSYLLSGSGTITNPAIGYVGAGASTYAKISVPTVSVNVFVQRYNGSSWTTVANWSTSATNANYVTTSKTLSVTRGYYYRVYSVHNANGESNFGATNGIYIS